jgi:hypothetical protein
VQIISGKLGVILMTCCSWVVVVLPLMLVCIQYKHGGGLDPITPAIAIITYLLIGATMWCGASYGLLLSWLCRRTMSAISWAITTLVTLYCFIPVAILVLELVRTNESLAAWHPVIGAGILSSIQSTPEGVQSVLSCIVLLFSLGLVFLAFLTFCMHRDIRERDGNFAAAVATPDATTATLAPGQS